MRLVWVMAVFVSWCAEPQEIAPEVLQLARIKLHLSEEVERLPNYTCLETVSRFQKQSWQQGLAPLDTVRLEVVYSGHREWYGSPGERKLGVSNPIDFVASGLMGTGSFAMSLHNLLAAADVTYKGEEQVRGHRAFRYDFRLSHLEKALMISLRGGQGIVGEEGTFYVDPESLDVLRLEARVTEIPAYLPLAESDSTVNFVRTRIGGADALVAQHATLHMLETSGAEGYDRLDFTHCRAFSSESAIHFEAEGQAPPEERPGGTPPADPTDAVPAFLPVTLLLTTPISDGTPVGTMIEAKVAGDVRHKGKVVIAGGAIVQGRIRRLEQFRESPWKEFLVGLEFTEVGAVEGRRRFYADFVRMEKNPKVRPAPPERIPVPGPRPGQERYLVLPDLPGVASVFVSGKSFTIPAGFRMVWRTRGLIRGSE
jgi:hypothetical protein